MDVISERKDASGIRFNSKNKSILKNTHPPKNIYYYFLVFENTSSSVISERKEISGIRS